MPIVDFILHVDQHLLEFVRQYGTWIYAILFLIIFVETGLVVMPFLPGDSLLFAAGAVAASTGVMDPYLLAVLLITSAVFGDTVNYHVGKAVGPKAFELNSRWINQSHLYKTQAFFAQHGGKTIIFARFVPFARTFAPFVAGTGRMNYRYFLSYNVIGAVAWVSSFVGLGYAFGNLPVVKDNFTHLIFGIIILSIMPAVFAWLNDKYRQKKGAGA